MPIRFRCTYCNRLLGIATRKAGTETLCPHCGYTITVPMPPADENRTERINVDDVEQVLANGVTERIAEPATQVVAPPPPAPKPAPPPLPKAAPPKPVVSKPQAGPPPVPRDPNDPPLFERDLNELFGDSAVLVEPDRPKPPPTSGADALSLGAHPRTITLTSGQATLLLCAAVVLMALSFATGYFLAR